MGRGRLAVGLVAVLLSGCRGSGSASGGDVDGGTDGGTLPPFDAGLDGGLTCMPPNSTLNLGATEQLTVDGLSAPASLRWTSTAPAIASVDANGLVTALNPGSASIVVETSSEFGVCNVDVVTACTNIDKVTGWTGAMLLDFSDSVTGSTSVSILHHFAVTFTLTKDPNSTVPYVHFVGKPAGTGKLQESESISGGASVSQTGNGPVYSVGDFALTVDSSSCAYVLEWLWALDTTYTVNGSGMPVNQVNIGHVQSDSTPLAADWPTNGAALSVALPAKGQLGVLPNVAQYLLLTQISTAYFNVKPIGATAQVTFNAKPTP